MSSWFASPPPPPPPLELPYEIVGAVLILLITFLIISKITAPRPLPAGKITGVVVYPLKSARGVNVRRASLDTRGLVYDRLWMAVDARGSFLSQRRAPKLALVEPGENWASERYRRSRQHEWIPGWSLPIEWMQEDTGGDTSLGCRKEGQLELT